MQYWAFSTVDSNIWNSLPAELCLPTRTELLGILIISEEKDHSSISSLNCLIDFEEPLYQAIKLAYIYSVWLSFFVLSKGLISQDSAYLTDFIALP